MKTLNITAEGVTIDEYKITDWGKVIKKHFVDYFLASYRKISLDYGITLYIIDSVGIRCWTKDDKVTHAQIFFEKQVDEKYPENAFHAQFAVNGNAVPMPLKVEDLPNIGATKIALDDDSIRFDVYLYQVYFNDRKYTFYADKENRVITSLYF